MTEVEQVITALIIDKAKQLESKKFRGPISLLRQETEGSYGLAKYAGAFDTALETLESNSLAKVHRYPGVEDYVSVDTTGTMATFHLGWLANGHRPKGDGFSFEEPEPDNPIIATYLDVGAGWLHNFALSLRDDDAKGVSNAVSSASWTGRYLVSEEDHTRFRELIVEMRHQIEEMELTNSERSNAVAALNAVEALSEAADPAWALIIKILQSPILANVTALVALAVAIIQS